jgi:hypothetical protein
MAALALMFSLRFLPHRRVSGPRSMQERSREWLSTPGSFRRAGELVREIRS